MTGRIVVLGATGYAGGLAVEALVRRGARPVIAGLRPQALAATAERFGGLDTQVADVTDFDSVRALVEPGDVLVTTVGPFERLGFAAARAAAEQGAHYVDSTGEVGFVRAIHERHDAVARKTGAVMVPAFGNDYVPGVLAGAVAAREAGDSARSLDIGYFVDGSLRRGRGLSSGTRATMSDAITLPVTVWKNGRLEDQRAASRVLTFDAGARRKAAMLATGTEVLFLPPAFPHLESVEVYNGWFPELSRAMSLLSAVVNTAVRIEPGRRLVAAVTGRSGGAPGGPDAAERSRSGAHTVAVARDRGGAVLAEVHATGPNVYDLTAELMAWAADRLASGHGEQPGVVGPVEAFGLDTLLAAGAKMGLTVGADPRSRRPV